MVAVWQLRSLGLSASAIRSRVAAGKLHRLYRGVYAVGHTVVGREGRWLAAVFAYGPRAVLSHRSAAMLWAIHATDRAAIDISLPSRRPRSRRGIDAHGTATLTSADITIRNAIPCTSVARTLLDLAEVVRPGELQRAYEAAERLERLDVRSIHALLARSNGRRGVGALRALLDYDPTAAARARSELERRFLDLLRNEGLPLPLVNTYVEEIEVDAFWPDARLVVELDSWEFHRGRSAFERDREKIAKLRLAGYEVLPLTDRRLRRGREWVVGSLRTLLGRT